MVNYWELVATPNTKLLLHLNGNSTDASGNGNNWTDTNITYVNGVFWQGALFNGSSSKITIPNATPLNLSTDFTVSMWINTTSLTSSPCLAIKWVFSSAWRYIQLSTTWFVALMLNTSGAFKEVDSVTWVITNWSWIHLTVVKSWTAWYIYKNWVAVWLSKNETLPANIVASSNPLYIWTYNNTQNFLDGKLDEVIIQDRALSSTEALNHYNQSKGVYAPRFNS